jgi:hypothetical protein
MPKPFVNRGESQEDTWNALLGAFNLLHLTYSKYIKLSWSVLTVNYVSWWKLIPVQLRITGDKKTRYFVVNENYDFVSVVQ